MTQVMLSRVLTILDHEELADTSLAHCIYCQEILVGYCCSIIQGRRVVLYFVYEREPDDLKFLYRQNEARIKENGTLSCPW
jgi:hypothetical protein